MISDLAYSIQATGAGILADGVDARVALAAVVVGVAAGDQRRDDGAAAALLRVVAVWTDADHASHRQRVGHDALGGPLARLEDGTGVLAL